MKPVFERAKRAVLAADAFLVRHKLIFGLLTAALLAGGLALLNIDVGPLHNLNDSTSYRSRLLFILMTGAVHGAAMFALALVHRGGAARLLLRQVIVTAGLFIALLGINQKTFFYTENILPLLRAMDAQGLSAFAGTNLPLSAPAATLLYLLTRLPVFDLYLVKLACIGAWLAVSVMAAQFAQEKGMGWRAETLLALSMILPQAFMNAACTALLDVIAVALLAGALLLLGRKKDIAACAVFAASAMVGGVTLYALPLFVIGDKKRLGKKSAAFFAVVLAACLPALLSGVPVGEVAGSLVGVNLMTPPHAAGAPNVLAFVPRALVEEMPQYPLLEKFAVDAVTNAEPFYTQAHFDLVSRGVTLALLAGFGGAALFVWRKPMQPIAKALALVLLALLCCPGATSGAWLAADLLCLYAVLAAPKLRLPACLVLFATAGSGTLPMLGETLLPQIAALGLVLTALMMTLDMIPLPAGESEA